MVEPGARDVAGARSRFHGFSAAIFLELNFVFALFLLGLDRFAFELLDQKTGVTDNDSHRVGLHGGLALGRLLVQGGRLQPRDALNVSTGQNEVAVHGHALQLRRRRHETGVHVTHRLRHEATDVGDYLRLRLLRLCFSAADVGCCLRFYVLRDDFCLTRDFPQRLF